MTVVLDLKIDLNMTVVLDGNPVGEWMGDEDPCIFQQCVPGSSTVTSIEDDEFCARNDEFCIKNDEFCVLNMINFVLKIMNFV